MLCKQDSPCAKSALCTLQVSPSPGRAAILGPNICFTVPISTQALSGFVMAFLKWRDRNTFVRDITFTRQDGGGQKFDWSIVANVSDVCLSIKEGTEKLFRDLMQFSLQFVLPHMFTTVQTIYKVTGYRVNPDLG